MDSVVHIAISWAGQWGFRTLAVGMLMWGCAGPQPIEPWVPPAEANEPPVLDLVTAEPSAAVPCLSVRDGSSGFRIGVRDPNGPSGQSLQARWFADYDPDVPRSALILQTGDLHPLAVGSDVYAPAEMPLTALSAFDWADGSTHTVEVVVAESFAAGDVAPRNRAVPSGSGSATHKWAFTYRSRTPCSTP